MDLARLLSPRTYIYLMLHARILLDVTIISNYNNAQQIHPSIPPHGYIIQKTVFDTSTENGRQEPRP